MPKRRRYNRQDAGAVAFIFVIVVTAILWFISRFWGLLVAAAAIALLVFLYIYFRRRRRRKIITSEIGEHLYKALKIMDTVRSRWYNDEDEANRELVLCLKSMGIEAEQEYRLPNGRKADAKVGDVLIEGKLSPNTADVDRLIGQLSDYTQYSDKLNIVIYGRLDKNAKKRIENEIHLKYLNKVFLTYLDNPRRQRPSNIY